MNVESEKHLISAENASPSHRDIEVEFFHLEGLFQRPPNDLLAQTCQLASRKNKIKVTSKFKIALELVQFGVKEQVAKKMTESLKIDSNVSFVTGYCNSPFMAIVDRPELPESLQLPYKIKWTTIS